MRHRLRLYPLALLASALATVTAACGSPSAPERGVEAFVLRSVDSQSLPAAVSNTAGGRLIEVVGGSIIFANLAGRGSITGSSELRITDPGVEPRVERIALAGTSLRHGDVVDVQYSTGARESFAVAQGGVALHTVAASCAPTMFCPSILHVFHYEREATTL